MNSDKAKKGYMRSPHRSLLKAAGYTDWEIERPWIGIANAYNAIIPDTSTCAASPKRSRPASTPRADSR